MPQRTETLTLSPSRIKAHHPKCPKVLSHVLSGQLTHNHPQYPSPQKASNIPDHTAALKMPLNVTNAHPPTHSNNELLNSSRQFNNNYNCNLNDNGSSPDFSERFSHGQHMSEPPTTSTGAPADQQKTILQKIPNVSESEQLLVSV